MLSLICTRINGRVNNGEAGDLRRYRAHCDVIVMQVEVSRRTSIWRSQRKVVNATTDLGFCDNIYNKVIDNKNGLLCLYPVNNAFQITVLFPYDQSR